MLDCDDIKLISLRFWVASDGILFELQQCGAVLCIIDTLRHSREVRYLQRNQNVDRQHSMYVSEFRMQHAQAEKVEWSPLSRGREYG